MASTFQTSPGEKIKEFQAGVTEGQDPSLLAGQAAAAEGKVITTSIESDWLSKTCHKTGHTFRTGDEVIIDERGPRLAVDPEFRSAADLAEFVKGLNDGKPRDDVEVTLLAPGHPLLQPSENLLQRKSCFVCGHTFRPAENVVICPCTRGGRVEPRMCERAVHRHPMLGLNCYDAWTSDERQTKYCPVTHRELK